MITCWDDRDREIRREQEADAREAMRDACTLCGDRIEGEPDEFWAVDGEHHITHPVCADAWEAIVGDTNVLDVPEAAHYRRHANGDRAVITYAVRGPGERDWQPVRLFTPEEDTSAPAASRVRSQGFVPRGY